MIKLSVNINKIATLRNSRGGNVPDPVKTAVMCEAYGANGITVHPRPDERHIRRSDVFELKKVVKTEFNIEGYPSENFIEMVELVKPTQITLVPDPPDVLTSGEGWNILENREFLQNTITRFHKSGIRVSLFMETNIDQIRAAAELKADRIELYTGPYAQEYPRSPAEAVWPFTEAARAAGALGLGVNAGHDLNLDNLNWFALNVPGLLEVSIGHALISDALIYGLSNTIRMYSYQLRKQ